MGGVGVKLSFYCRARASQTPQPRCLGMRPLYKCLPVTPQDSRPRQTPDQRCCCLPLCSLSSPLLSFFSLSLSLSLCLPLFHPHLKPDLLLLSQPRCGLPEMEGWGTDICGFVVEGGGGGGLPRRRLAWVRTQQAVQRASPMEPEQEALSAQVVPAAAPQSQPQPPPPPPRSPMTAHPPRRRLMQMNCLRHDAEEEG